MARRRVRLLVSGRGRVQGVFFRDSARREAEALGVSGWARNLADGRVEVVAEGDEPALERMIQWCRGGPPRATVTNVELHDEPTTGDTGFAVR